MNDRNITNAKFIQVIQLPQTDTHLTAKLYVDNAINESSLLRLDPDEKLKLNEQDSIIPNSILTSPKTIIEIPTKVYIDSLHDENERNRRNFRLAFYNEEVDLVKSNQDNDLNDKKLTNLDSITVNRNPNLDNELSNKKHIDYEFDKNTILRFIQTLSKYLKVSVGNYTYFLTKYDKIPLPDVTEIISPNIGRDLLLRWREKYLNKISNTKIGNFIKSTVTNSPSSHSRATFLPPIGTAFLYIETTHNNHGHNKIFVSWERTEIIQISNINFYYNRFSILTDDSKKSMGRFKVQLLSKDNSLSTLYTIIKNTNYSNLSTDWSFLNLNFTTENYGIKLS